MIFDKIIQICLAMVNGILNLLPDWQPPDFGSWGGGIGNAGAAMNAVFPVTTLILCLTTIVTLRIFMLGWKICLFVYAIVPFKAT